MCINKNGYYDFGSFLKKHFTYKVQKISLNVGFTCPNRDGSKGTGGCTYCNNQTFNPEYCNPHKSITQQLEEGKSFFSRKYPEMKYLAYFQAYTNTYGKLENLTRMYEEALQVEDVVGIIIGTRPDCVEPELIEYLKNLSKTKFVLIEYGVETANNNTLDIINRHHTWEDSVNAIKMTAEAGILCGAHIILGLPNETEDDIINTAKALAPLPLSTLKLHQLQLIRGTKLARQIEDGEYKIINWDVNDYIKMCSEFIKYIPSTISVERFVSQSPASLLISPRWGLKNYEFTNLLNNYLVKNNIIQGSKIN